MPHSNPAGGRKRNKDTDPALLKALLVLVEPTSGVIRSRRLKWTTKSLRNLAQELTRQGTQRPRRRWACCCDRRADAHQQMRPQASGVVQVEVFSPTNGQAFEADDSSRLGCYVLPISRT
ncbi:hypothetical protein GCM10010244_85750 [Streptomyces coeruleorubidus]|nr:hypothetical protein GCM10010244_85750 [Streptomyces bellus]